MAPSYIIQRALYAVPIAIGVTVICFALIYLGPVDPVAAVTPDDATPEQIAMIRTALWLRSAAAGAVFDLARPLSYGAISASLSRPGRPVVGVASPCAREHLYGSPSWRLSSASRSPFAWACSRRAGMIAGSTASLSAVAAIGVSIPSYWFANCSGHRLLGRAELAACDGHGPGGAEQWSWDLAHVRHLVLPASRSP